MPRSKIRHTSKTTASRTNGILPAQPGLTHEQLRVLVDHISTLLSALDVRLQACEAALPVDPQVKTDADAFLAAKAEEVPPALVLHAE